MYGLRFAICMQAVMQSTVTKISQDSTMAIASKPIDSGGAYALETQPLRLDREGHPAGKNCARMQMKSGVGKVAPGDVSLPAIFAI